MPAIDHLGRFLVPALALALTVVAADFEESANAQVVDKTGRRVIRTEVGRRTADGTNKPAIGPDEPKEGFLQVRLNDGGTIMVKPLSETVTIKTAYGKLVVPIAEITSVELAQRLPEDIVSKVDAAIARLASAKSEERTAATPELFNMREKAYAGLVRASRSKDKELAKRANELLDDLRGRVPSHLLDIRVEDLVQTADSRFTGMIEEKSIKVHSATFGDVELKLADLNALGSQGADASGTVLNYDGNLMQYQGQFNRILSFRVAGQVGGTVWGSGPYTADSDLGTAAVHAGVLRPNQVGIVRVQIVESPNSFSGSFRNGVNSNGYGPFPVAFRIRANR